MAHQLDPNMYHFRGQIDIDTGVKLIAYASHIGMSVSALLRNIICNDPRILNYKPPFPIGENIKAGILERMNKRREDADRKTAMGRYRKGTGGVSVAS